LSLDREIGGRVPTVDREIRSGGKVNGSGVAGGRLFLVGFREGRGIMRAGISALVAVLRLSLLLTSVPSLSAAECVRKDLAGSGHTIVEGGKKSTGGLPASWW